VALKIIRSEKQNAHQMKKMLKEETFQGEREILECYVVKSKLQTLQVFIV